MADIKVILIDENGNTHEFKRFVLYASNDGVLSKSIMNTTNMELAYITQSLKVETELRITEEIQDQHTFSNLSSKFNK